MSMMKLEGYFDDNGQFIPFAASASVIPKNKKLTILVSDEPVTNADGMTNSVRKMKALEKFLREDTEPLPDGFEEFIQNNRVNTTRELDL